jgi:hypothetical protein
MANRFQRDELRAFAETWRANEGSKRTVRLALGMSHSGYDRRLAAARAAGYIKDTKFETERKRVQAAHEAPETPAERREVVRLRDKVTRLQAQLAEIDRDELTDAEVREKILGLAAQTPEPPKWLVRETRGSGVTGVPSTIWSDWHLGEVVNRAEVNGVNEFNLSIAERRIRALVERIVDLCKNHMTSPRYPGIVVNLIGDIVSGGIHPELAENDEDELFPSSSGRSTGSPGRCASSPTSSAPCSSPTRPATTAACSITSRA